MTRSRGFTIVELLVVIGVIGVLLALGGGAAVGVAREARTQHCGSNLRQLALATFTGAAQLAAQSGDPVELLRQRVTSKGGTTHAAISSMEAAGVKEAIVAAMRAAADRGRELGDELGKD